MKGDYSGEGEIVVLCPSRENAAGAAAMVESFLATRSLIETQVVVVVDRDDPQLDAYLALADPERLRPPYVMVVDGGSLTKATNEAAARIWDVDCIMGHVGDDHRFRTPGWDKHIKDALEELPGVCYTNDGFRSMWASSWFANSIIPRTLGWFAVPGSMHLSIDDVYMDIGGALPAMTYLHDTLIEHEHPSGGKVPWRDIVKSHYTPAKRALESANYKRYTDEDFPRDIARLREVLGLPADVPWPDMPGRRFRVRWLLAHQAPEDAARAARRRVRTIL